MRLLCLSRSLFLACAAPLSVQAGVTYDIKDRQHPTFSINHDDSNAAHRHRHAISVELFADLERLARLVDIAYCVGMTGISKPFTCISRCKEFPTLELVETWNTGMLMTDSCGYIAVDHGKAPFADSGGGRSSDDKQGAIIVAFRGTYSITNTVVDLSTVPQEYVPYPEPGDGDDGSGDKPREKCANCTVHLGFLASWRSARELILPVLVATKAQYPGHAVNLVGHSLGGAVAALAALELKLVLGWEDLTVTTFGEPRVGNDGLATFIDHVFDMEDEDEDPEMRTYRRVTHAQDPVPLLPLSEWGYRPHAGEIFIDKIPLPPSLADLRPCRGDRDPCCSAGGEDGEGCGGDAFAARVGELAAAGEPERTGTMGGGGDADAQSIPTRPKLWQLFFAHRDYFWRLGLCVPGGDPADWGREKYDLSRPSRPDEL